MSFPVRVKKVKFSQSVPVNKVGNILPVKSNSKVPNV